MSTLPLEIAPILLVWAQELEDVLIPLGVAHPTVTKLRVLSAQFYGTAQAAPISEPGLRGIVEADSGLSEELDAYVAHLKALGYPSSEITLMIIGFSAGWDAQRGARSAS